MLNRTRQGSTYLCTETKRWILASTSGCGFLLLPPRVWLKSWHNSRRPHLLAASVWAQDNESRDSLPVGTPMSLTPLQGSGHSQRSNSGGPQGLQHLAEDWAHLEGVKRSSCLVTSTPFRGTRHVQCGNSGSPKRLQHVVVEAPILE